jgi:hypothetical protein
MHKAPRRSTAVAKFGSSESGYEVVDPSGKYRQDAQQVANEHRDDPNYVVTFNGEAVEPEPLHKSAETSVAVAIESLARKRRRASRRPPVHCSFCGCGNDEARKIVTGPGVYICNYCVAICVDIIGEEDLTAVRWMDRFGVVTQVQGAEEVSPRPT